MYSKILTVTAVNNYIKKVIDSDFILKNSNIKGELSNVKIHSSGHIYFSLKDNFAKITCVMFRTATSNLKFIPKDGMNVIVSGNISVYEKEGVYQLYCNDMSIEGEGELYLAFEKLKRNLESEGLFDNSRKKPIPKYSKRIGVVTSPTGAAIRDIIKVSTRRNSKVDIIIYPSLVQGLNAASNIIEGIKKLNEIDDIDVIVLARGGGSIEELWCFNEESVARAIAASKKPIITGIGHETDFTICDFVADYRAATPSQAAEIAVYHRESLVNNINSCRSNMENILKIKINREFMYLDKLYTTLRLNSPNNYILNQHNKLEGYRSKLQFLINMNMTRYKSAIDKLNHQLVANNPLFILNKGYGLIMDINNHNISSIEELKKQNVVNIRLKDGTGAFKLEYLED